MDRFFNITQSQWTSTYIKSHRIVRLTGVNGYAKGSALLALLRPCVKPTSPVAANLPCLTGSSALGGVLNSFVLPVLSWVPLMLLGGVCAPWCNSLRLPALYLLMLHSCTSAPLNWRTLPGCRVSLSGCCHIRANNVHSQLLRIIIHTVLENGIEDPN